MHNIFDARWDNNIGISHCNNHCFSLYITHISSYYFSIYLLSHNGCDNIINIVLHYSWILEHKQFINDAHLEIIK